MGSVIPARRRISLAIVLALAVAFTALSVVPASAKPSSSLPFSLFGDGTLVHPGHNSPTAAQASYDGTSSFGGVDFVVPAGLTVAKLLNLNTDYQFTVGSCQGGAPRFVASVTNGTTSGNINFYIGPPPNYTGCALNVWANSGNLATPTNLVDDSQLPGGTFYDPYATTQTKFGTYTVTDVFLVTDGFQPTPQTVQFDNTMVNQAIYTYEKRHRCHRDRQEGHAAGPGLKCGDRDLKQTA